LNKLPAPNPRNYYLQQEDQLKEQFKPSRWQEKRIELFGLATLQKRSAE
jgi:hypothetical protein